jgi:hypothetical protein
MAAQRAVLKAQLRGCMNLVNEYDRAGWEEIPTPLKRRIEVLLNQLMEMEAVA